MLVTRLLFPIGQNLCHVVFSSATIWHRITNICRTTVQCCVVIFWCRSTWNISMIVTSSSVEVRSIAMSVSVCLGSLYVRSRISKTVCPNFTKFAIHVSCGRGSVLLWRQCGTLCMPTSGYVGDVMFLHNRANGRESQTTRMFRRVRQMAAPQAKSAASDCILLTAYSY